MDVEAGLAEINSVENLDALESLRVEYLGKKGRLTQALKQLSSLPAASRAEQGAVLNQGKKALIAAINEKKQALTLAEQASALAKQRLDISLPGTGRALGHHHPVSQSIRELEQLFAQLGFQSVVGPEIEDDYHNFTALNIPDYHPARAMHDTFYLPGALLRTHTSCVQVRTLAAQGVPLRIVTPGRVYRCDSDPTHTPMFHQFEGLVVDEQCNFSEMITVLKSVLSAFFGRDLPIRLRPSYFPFTEPSCELDVAWKEGEWLEVLGCGMVHPAVLREQGIDTDRYVGYAFGLGVDRFAMLKYGIDDLRLFFENDQDFLSQF